MPVTLKDIHEEVQGVKDVIVHGVQHVVKLPLWVKIVAGVVIILFIVLIVTLFKKKEPVNTDYLQKIEEIDKRIEAYEELNKTREIDRARRDTVIMENLDAIKNNRSTTTRIIERYEKIPSDVKSLDRNKLRDEVTNF